MGTELIIFKANNISIFKEKTCSMSTSVKVARIQKWKVNFGNKPCP